MKEENVERFLKGLVDSGKKETRSWLISWKNNINLRINEVDELLYSTKKAIKFFTGNGFARGRSDELSSAYFDCFLRAYESIFDDLNINTETLTSKSMTLLEEYRKEVAAIAYNVHEGDVKMVRSVFRDFLPELQEWEYNPIRYVVDEIKKGNFDNVFERIDKIEWLGTKLTSMLLRNLVVYFNLNEHLKPHHYSLLFPVDTHVRQIVKLIWPETEQTEDDKEIMRYVAEKAKEHRISPLYLNVGLWLIHSRAPGAMEVLFEELND